MLQISRKITCWTLISTLFFSLPVSGNDIKLPDFGDVTSGIISHQQEYQLGREWLRAYRSRVAELNDPQIQYYLENLLFKLAIYSELEDRRLELVMVNNSTMNAFAVPGGVVGIHTGLFRYAENEHQLASVLTHEIAHLSQRHFARRLEKQRANTYLTMAGLLASLILAATAGGDAGMAGMAATQAASLESQLRYSRQNEQEADRLGIETLYQAGYDPLAAPAMFEGMLQATRYIGSRPPEFLLTHPLTESRIADAQGRARTYPFKHYPNPLDYQLMKARALIYITDNPALSIKYFSSEVSGDTASRIAAQYGLAIAHLANNDPQSAWKTLAPLLANDSENVYFRLAEAEINRNQKKFDDAEKILKKLLASHPDYYPAKISLVRNYLAENRFHAAEKLLEELSEQRPTDPFIWYDLAETRGLAGNISGVHLARAEFFILVGAYDLALQQLGYARKLVTADYRQSAIISQRIRDLEEMQKDRKL